MSNPIPLWKTSLLGCCPRCGKGKIFSSFLNVASACGACGLSFVGREQGDGPAFFAITLIGALTAIGAVAVEFTWEPPFWLHATIWLPFVCIGSVVSLRVFKAALIGFQYALKPADFG